MSNSRETWLGVLLAAYLFLVGVGAATIVVVNFPTEQNGVVSFSNAADDPATFWPFGQLSSPAQGMLAIAFLVGIVGSFLHAAQSLGSYMGNKKFRPSWTIWYVLRPWIGGILGLSIYLTLRAGLVGGAGNVDPYGAAAFGLLGGWFSKITTDKLQEVFETLFKTEQDKKRKDKLVKSDESGEEEPDRGKEQKTDESGEEEPDRGKEQKTDEGGEEKPDKGKEQKTDEGGKEKPDKGEEQKN